MKQIVNNFNKSIKKTLLKLDNEIKNFFKENSTVSNFNKFIITFISLLFLSLFYLLIPTLYEKTWLQNTIEDKLLKDSKLNFSISSDITYNILPTPHYLIKNSKIFIGDDAKLKAIAEIKKLRIFIDKSNFFDKEKINIRKILIDNANFSFQGSDLKLLNEINNKKFSNKKIKIIKSNIFFKNNSNEIIAIVKVPQATLFYDDLRLLNLMNIEGNVFKTPFIFNLEKTVSSLVNNKINFGSKKLKLKIFNESSKKSNDLIEGLNTILYFNSKIGTQYNIKKNLISFKFDPSRTKDSNIYYNGKLSLNPFDLDLSINLKKYEINKLFNSSSLMKEFIKTKLLFNENISANVSINIDSNKYDKIFESSIIKFNAINRSINFDNTKLVNEKIGSLEIAGSDLFFENERLILNADAIINIKDSKKLFSLLQTPTKSRKLIKNILINFDYDVLTGQINLNNLKVDGTESTNKMLNIISEFNNNDEYSMHKSRKVFNKLISAYEG